MSLRAAQRRAAEAVARRLGEPYRILRFVADPDIGATPDPARASLDVRAVIHGALATVKPDASISGRHHLVGEALGRSETAMVPLSAFASRTDWPIAGDRFQPLDGAGVPIPGESVLEVVTADPDRTEQLVVTLSRIA